MYPTSRQRWPNAFSFAGLVSLLVLTGCSNFFVSPDNGGGGGGSTSNLVYAANAASQTIGAYQVSTGALTAVSGSPFSISFTPQAVVVSRADTYLYVSATGGGIYGYSIGSNGSLTSLGQLVGNDVLAMDVSPDGQGLVGLDATAQVLDVFQIDTSTGALTLLPQTPYTTASIPSPRVVRFAPSGAYIFAALGSAGEAVFSFTTASGLAGQVQSLALSATTVSDNSLAVNSASTLLYVARSGTSSGVAVYSIGTNGSLSPVAGSPFAAGNTPSDVVVDPTGKYVYAANRGDGTISGFLIGSTVALTPLGGSPYGSGALVTSLAVDKSSTYLLAGANGSYPDLTMYSFDATTAGKLDTVASITSSTTAGLVAIAATH